MYYDPSGHGCEEQEQNIPLETQGKQVAIEGGTQDIYRAVSPEEYDDIFATGGFESCKYVLINCN